MGHLCVVVSWECLKWSGNKIPKYLAVSPAYEIEEGHRPGNIAGNPR